MLDAIKNWYTRNYTEITWFIIGWLCLSGLMALASGNLISAVVSLGLAWLNFAVSRR